MLLYLIAIADDSETMLDAIDGYIRIECNGVVIQPQRVAKGGPFTELDDLFRNARNGNAGIADIGEFFLSRSTGCAARVDERQEVSRESR